jgi:hypothetical protein
MATGSESANAGRGGGGGGGGQRTTPQERRLAEANRQAANIRRASRAAGAPVPF